MKELILFFISFYYFFSLLHIVVNASAIALNLSSRWERLRLFFSSCRIFSARLFFFLSRSTFVLALCGLFIYASIALHYWATALALALMKCSHRVGERIGFGVIEWGMQIVNNNQYPAHAIECDRLNGAGICFRHEFGLDAGADNAHIPTFIDKNDFWNIAQVLFQTYSQANRTCKHASNYSTHYQSLSNWIESNWTERRWNEANPTAFNVVDENVPFDVNYGRGIGAQWEMYDPKRTENSSRVAEHRNFCVSNWNALSETDADATPYRTSINKHFIECLSFASHCMNSKINLEKAKWLIAWNTRQL